MRFKVGPRLSGDVSETLDALRAPATGLGQNRSSLPDILPQLPDRPIVEFRRYMAVEVKNRRTQPVLDGRIKPDHLPRHRRAQPIAQECGEVSHIVAILIPLQIAG